LETRPVGSLRGSADTSAQFRDLCHTQTYNAFANAMSKTFTAAGSFAWRGAEGSVTDREPGTVTNRTCPRQRGHGTRRRRAASVVPG
jgi:hypothetical protein